MLCNIFLIVIYLFCFLVSITSNDFTKWFLAIEFIQQCPLTRLSKHSRRADIEHVHCISMMDPIIIRARHVWSNNYDNYPSASDSYTNTYCSRVWCALVHRMLDGTLRFFGAVTPTRLFYSNNSGRDWRMHYENDDWWSSRWHYGHMICQSQSKPSYRMSVCWLDWSNDMLVRWQMAATAQRI